MRISMTEENEPETVAKIVTLGAKPCLVASFTRSVEPVLWQVVLDQAPSLSLAVGSAGPEHVLTLQNDQGAILARARFNRHDEAETAHAVVAACLLQGGKGSFALHGPSTRTVLIAFAIFALLLVFVPSHRRNVEKANEPQAQTSADRYVKKGKQADITPQDALIKPHVGEPQSADKLLKNPMD